MALFVEMLRTGHEIVTDASALISKLEGADVMH